MSAEPDGSVENESLDSVYKDETLQTHEIRLLTILPKETGESDDVLIRCRLETVDLNKKRTPDYTTLSYTWGEAEGNAVIEVNDVIMKATTNLRDALKHFRTQEPIPKLWVDAICINQKHNPEKEGQVRRMQTIFAKAEKTWVWLGLESNESERAIGLVEKLGKVYDESCKDGETSPKFADTWASLKNQGLEDDLLALDHLLAREYWYRVWIVQEIAVSKKLTLFCGQHKFCWDSLLFTAYLLNLEVEAREIIQKKRSGSESPRGLLGGVQRILSVQSVRNDVHDSSKEKSSDSLLSLLSNHRFTGATNKRDKYIALAGITEIHRNTESNGSEEKNQLYGEEEGDVYITACEMLMIEERHRPLDFLDCAGLPRNFVMPSWVPDWSVTQGRAVPLLYWDLATKRASDIVLFNAPGRTNKLPLSIHREKPAKAALVARGCRVGLLKEVNTMTESPIKQNEDQMAADSTQNVHPKHLTRKDLADVLWRTLVLNRAHADGRKAPENWGDIFYQYLTHPPIPPPPLSSHQEWYRRSKQFKVCGSTLEELAQEWGDTMSGQVYDQVELAQFKAAFTNAVAYRKLASTEEGRLSLVPSDARPGDLVVVLSDCSVPVLLRRRKGEEISFEFIGTCYVHGIMQGEAVHGLHVRDEFPESFTIR